MLGNRPFGLIWYKTGSKETRKSPEVIKYSHHEDFPNTIDGKEVAEEVEVFALECLWVLNSLLREVKVIVIKIETKICMQNIYLQYKNCDIGKNERTLNIRALTLWDYCAWTDCTVVQYNFTTN